MVCDNLYKLALYISLGKINFMFRDLDGLQSFSNKNFSQDLFEHNNSHHSAT